MNKLLQLLRKTRWLWLNILAIALILVALCLGVKWWLGSYTHHGEGIEVPDLYGMTHQKALHRLDTLGLLVVVNDSSYVDDLPAGAIVSQQPAAGMKVKQGRIIYVTINSLTMPCERIPDLIDNCSFREAQARLKSLGFVLLEPKLIDGEKDWVYGIQYRGHNVIAGAEIPKESELTLVIGNGSTSEEIELDVMEETLPPGLTGDNNPDDVDDFLEVVE